MIPYDRYTELLSKLINRTIVEAEQADLARFEALNPKFVPSVSVLSGVPFHRRASSTTLKNAPAK